MVANPPPAAPLVPDTTPYGSKKVALAAGASTSVAFASRLTTVPAGSATIAASGPEGRSHNSTVAIPAGLCG
jgi:hypothetical protein